MFMTIFVKDSIDEATKSKKVLISQGYDPKRICVVGTRGRFEVRLNDSYVPSWCITKSKREEREEKEPPVKLKDLPPGWDEDKRGN
jgi:hypothetical protein